MKFIAATSILALVTFAAAAPPFNPKGVENVGNGHGKQFTTGQCLTDADCITGCCAKPNGICSKTIVAFKKGKEGCGFVSSSKASDLARRRTAAEQAAKNAQKPAASDGFTGPPPTPNPAGAKNVGNGKGKQFITGQCLSDSDCVSSCCAKPAGICSEVVASLQKGKQGCGFVSSSAASQPAADAEATADSATAAEPAAKKPSAKHGLSAKGQAIKNAQKPAASDGFTGPPPTPNPAGAKNVGNGQGKQFITGQCLSDSDCVSNCCAKPAGICSEVVASLQKGKKGCGFVSSLTASQTAADAEPTADSA